jgi:hypothetical protein
LIVSEAGIGPSKAPLRTHVQRAAITDEEPTMKMSTTMVQRCLSQYDAQAIPSNHPSLPELSALFGDHTFFLDGKGLNIVEATGSDGGNAAQVVNLASWADDSRTSLAPHEPEPTDVIVQLEPDRQH